MSRKTTGKSCGWGCAFLFFIVGGIIELILSIVTFNIVLFIWSIVSTFILLFLISRKIEQIDEEGKESDNTEGVEEDV